MARRGPYGRSWSAVPLAAEDGPCRKAGPEARRTSVAYAGEVRRRVTGAVTSRDARSGPDNFIKGNPKGSQAVMAAFWRRGILPFEPYSRDGKDG